MVQFCCECCPEVSLKHQLSSGVAQQRHSCFVSFPGDGLQLSETAALTPSLFGCCIPDKDLVFYFSAESKVFEVMKVGNRGKDSFCICQTQKFSRF